RCCVWSFFFFQAEDGIRDDLVTGVQTCALPIFPVGDIVVTDSTYTSDPFSQTEFKYVGSGRTWNDFGGNGVLAYTSDREGEQQRSEERRVGKEGRSRRAADDEKKRKRRKQEGQK